MGDREAGEGKSTEKRQPHRVRLPGFITDGEVGLGDLIKRATAAVGVEPCGGCDGRAARLNRLLVFSRNRPR